MALVPEIPQFDAVSEVDSVVNGCAEFAQLSEPQRKVLLGMMLDFLTENIRRDVDLAADCGVHRNTITNCKQNPRFNRVLVAVMPELVKSKLPKYLNKIEKHGDRDFRALQLLLEYAGLYMKSQKNVNLNANLRVNADGPGSPQQASESFCTLFMGIGYDEDSLVELVRSTYRRLKAEGL